MRISSVRLSMRRHASPLPPPTPGSPRRLLVLVPSSCPAMEPTRDVRASIPKELVEGVHDPTQAHDRAGIRGLDAMTFRTTRRGSPSHNRTRPRRVGLTAIPRRSRRSRGFDQARHFLPRVGPGDGVLLLPPRKHTGVFPAVARAGGAGSTRAEDKWPELLLHSPRGGVFFFPFALARRRAPITCEAYRAHGDAGRRQRVASGHVSSRLGSHRQRCLPSTRRQRWPKRPRSNASGGMSKTSFRVGPRRSTTQTSPGVTLRSRTLPSGTHQA